MKELSTVQMPLMLAFKIEIVSHFIILLNIISIVMSECLHRYLSMNNFCITWDKLIANMCLKLLQIIQPDITVFKRASCQVLLL